MSKKISAFTLFLVVLFLNQGCAAGAKNRDASTLTGTIRVVGSEPFTHMVLTVADAGKKPTDHLLTGPLVEELRRHHQGETVALDGFPCPPSPQFPHCFRPAKVTIINPR